MKLQRVFICRWELQTTLLIYRLHRNDTAFSVYIRVAFSEVLRTLLK